MLRLSQFPFKTLKNIPSGSDNRGTGLLLQAGMIRMTLAGVYTFTPMGLRVLRRIESIIREEMDAIGCSEILMSALGNRESWEATGRWNEIDVLFKVPAAEWREYALNPTHEESVTPLMGEFIQSYKDLDHLAVYQIQWKFRNEKRAKSGLLRGREFLMKDAYSFHRSQEDLDAFFEIMRWAYTRIFDRLWIGHITHYTFASGGDFSRYSYEFQTELDIGEDDIFICTHCQQAHNSEIVDPDAFSCVHCQNTTYTTRRASEVGNIFKLGSRFSDAFKIRYQDQNGNMQPVVMGCYGIGVTRLMGVIAEYAMNDQGIAWPEAVAPYDVSIIVIGQEQTAIGETLAAYYEAQGKSVILDDREGSKYGFGQKMKDAELWGIPVTIIISPKTREQWGYEYRDRSGVSSIRPLDHLTLDTHA